MKYLCPLALSLSLALIAQANAVYVEVDNVSCSTLALKINATAQQFANLPQNLQLTVENQIRVAPFPNVTTLPQHADQMVMQATVKFDQPFLLIPDGFYNMTMNLISDETANANHSVASANMSNIPFQGCTTASSPASTSINYGSYYPAIGVPTHGISTEPQGLNDESDSGLSAGAKIGITVGVLAVALLATLTAMALLFRRWKRKSELSTGSKATRYVDGKWVNEDRNSAELKEIHQTQV